VCESEAHPGGQVSVVLLDPESGCQELLAEQRAYASWSTDGQQVWLLRSRNVGPQTLIYDLNSQELRAEARGRLPYELADDPIWSSDGATVA